MTTNWTEKLLRDEMAMKDAAAAEFVKQALVESFKEALAERRERERLVWIEFATALANRSFSCSGPEVARLADDLTKEYVQRWEE